MKNISWKFVSLMGLGLLLVLPIAFTLGLVVDNFIFPSPVSAAYGWLLFLLPLNAIGGLIIGLAEGLIFNMFYTQYSKKQAWIILIFLIALVAIANSYLVLLPGLFTFGLNLALLYLCQRYLLDQDRSPLVTHSTK